VFTDHGVEVVPANVRMVVTSRDEFRRRFERALGVSVSLDRGYKVADPIFYFEEVGLTEIMTEERTAVYWEGIPFNFPAGTRRIGPPSIIPPSKNSWVWRKGKLFHLRSGQEVVGYRDVAGGGLEAEPGNPSLASGDGSPFDRPFHSLKWEEVPSGSRSDRNCGKTTWSCS
jgi:hypothetical protein